MSKNNVNKKVELLLTAEEAQALAKVFGPTLSREKVERRLLQQFMLAVDELKVLYPKDEDLYRFYLKEVCPLLTQIQSTESSDDFLDSEEDQVSDDTYKLSKRNKVMLEDLRLLEKREKRKKAADALKAIAPKSAEAKKAFEQAGNSLPKESQVSYEDFLKSVREGFKTDD